MTSLRREHSFRVGIASITTLLLASWLIVPPLWMILTSLKPEHLVFSIPPVWLFRPTLEHFREVFARPTLLPVLRNTVVVSVVSTLITQAVGTMAAYSIARFRTGGRALPNGILVVRVLPPIVLGLPFFILFRRFGLLGTVEGLVLAFTAFLLPNTIWLLIPFFNDVSREIEEAALVDGCSRFGTFVRIAVPRALPGLIVTGIHNFMGAWNHFFYALILAGADARTLPVEASEFVGEYVVRWGQISAMGTLLMIPPIAVVFLLQRYLVRGLLLGGIKG